MWHHLLVSVELASESELLQPPPAASRHISALDLDRASLFDKREC